jgi:hypothetical protein
VRTVRSVRLKQLDGMSLNEIIDFIEDMGYTTEALSNDDIYDLAVSIIDGHEDEGGDPEDLDFSMDFKGDAYHDV